MTKILAENVLTEFPNSPMPNCAVLLRRSLSDDDSGSSLVKQASQRDEICKSLKEQKRARSISHAIVTCTRNALHCCTEMRSSSLNRRPRPRTQYSSESHNKQPQGTQTGKRLRPTCVWFWPAAIDGRDAGHTYGRNASMPATLTDCRSAK